jgi:hypothetical protein
MGQRRGKKRKTLDDRKVKKEKKFIKKKKKKTMYAAWDISRLIFHAPLAAGCCSSSSDNSMI